MREKVNDSGECKKGGRDREVVLCSDITIFNILRLCVCVCVCVSEGVCMCVLVQYPSLFVE